MKQPALNPRERARLRWENWHFDKLDPKEFVHCWTYEYARDSPSLCREIDRYLDEKNESVRHLLYFGVVSFLTLPARELLDWFPDTPWQLIPSRFREAAVNEHPSEKGRNACGSLRVRSAADFSAKALALPIGCFLRTIPELHGEDYPDHRSILVNFDLSDDPRLLRDQFEQWLRQERKKAKPARPKNPRTYQKELKELGALRLLLHFRKKSATLEQAIELASDHTKKQLGRKNALLKDPEQWRRAKIHAQALIARIGEKPAIAERRTTKDSKALAVALRSILQERR